MQCTVSLTDHIGQLQVLRLEFTLELLSPVNGLLCRGRLQLEALCGLQEIQMLLSKLGIKLRQSLILGSPCVHLFLQRANLVVSRGILQVQVGSELAHLPFQILHTTIILLQHQLVPLILGSRIQVFALKIGQTTLGVRLILLLHELFLGQTLLLCLPALLFLKVQLRLLLHEKLLSLLLLPLLLETHLLRFKLFLLTPGFGAPEVVDGFGLGHAWLRWRGWLSLNLLGWSPW